MLQFISHATPTISCLEGISLALSGGCKWIQLRMKGISDDEVRPIALQVKKMCKGAGATFIIDDRTALVKELEADGVHLGKNDMPISEAHRLLGKGFIIGATANTFNDIQQHYNDGADYIGCGPFRFTTTKERLSPILGLDGYRDILAQMKQQSIDIPVVAIGGITRKDIPSIMETGVTGIAVSGSILNAVAPVEETRRIIETINKHSLWKN